MNTALLQAGHHGRVCAMHGYKSIGEVNSCLRSLLGGENTTKQDPRGTQILRDRHDIICFTSAALAGAATGGLVRVPDIKTAQSAETDCLDAWVLPFLNLYALAGNVDGHADIAIQPAVFPPKCSPKFDLRLDYEGPTVGLGGTLATAFKPLAARPTIVFGLADLNVIETFLDFQHVVASLDPVTVAVLNVRGGVRYRILHTSSLGDVYMSLWVSLMWEGVQETMSGDLSILDPGFQGQVKAVNPWNTIVGSRLEIGKHVDLMIDVGLGERKSLMLPSTLRF